MTMFLGVKDPRLKEPSKNNAGENTKVQRLREVLHKNYERLRREVAREMDREYRFQKDDMAAD